VILVILASTLVACSLAFAVDDYASATPAEGSDAGADAIADADAATD
jgi:hypothetical protein